MATEYVNSSLDHSRPTSTSSQVSSASGSTPSSATSSGSHRNRQLLKSYHEFAMHVFSNNKVTQESERLFLSAVREGDYPRVENFLKRRNHEGVNIDMKDFGSGDTPLIAACRNGHTKVVQLLLKFGADVTLRNYECETAVSVSSVAIRKMLLESVERSGCSHRHLLQAAWQGNISVVQQLLKEGKFLDVNCENEDGFTPLLLVTRDIKAFEKLQTVLKSYKPVEVVRVLLGQRADPSTTDSEGKTPLHHAAASSSSLAHQITLLLMKDKENLVAQDENSAAPIHVASRHGQVEILVALLDNGVDINSRGHAGATPLHVSASAGQLQIAHTLLDRGADVTLVDDRGNTPMDLANNRKMRATLKEAWTDATQARRGSTPVLSPVKPPSRRDHRRHSSSDDISPRDTEAPVSLTTNRVLQKLKDAHQALLSEGQLYRDIDNGNFTPSGFSPSTRTKSQGHHPSQRRSISPSKAPAPPKTPRGGNQRVTEGDPSSQVVKKRRSSSVEDRPVSSKLKGQGMLRGHPKLGYRHSDPTGSRPSERASIPVTVVGLDWDESVQDIRFSRLQQGTVFPGRVSQPSSSNGVPKRLTLDLAHNPSVQQVTDACSSYIKTRGSRVLHPQDVDNQPSLPAVSPSRPLSGSQRPNFFDGNHVSRTTQSPFMERLHGFLGTDLPARSDQMQQEAIFEIDCEENRTGKEESPHEAPLSPLRSALPSNSFRRPDLSHYPSNEPLQTVSPFAVATTTFNIEMSRVNQLKESSDSGQGSSRSTNSRASTISTPSPLLGEIDGSPSRLQGLGSRRVLHLQSVDGDSGTHLPSLPRDNVRRLDRVHALEERNFRVLSSSSRHNSEDTMSIVSVSSSVTVKTTDICGQRISLSHTLKEESEASNSPEQTLRDTTKVSDALKDAIVSRKESQSTGGTENQSSSEIQKEEPLVSNTKVVKKDTDIKSENITMTTVGSNFEKTGREVQTVSRELEGTRNSLESKATTLMVNGSGTHKEEKEMVSVKQNLAPKETENGNKLELLDSREQVPKLASSPPEADSKCVSKSSTMGIQIEKNSPDKNENSAPPDGSKQNYNHANKQKVDKVKARPVKPIQNIMEHLSLENKDSRSVPAAPKSHGPDKSVEKGKISGRVDGKFSEHSIEDSRKGELTNISKDSAKCKESLVTPRRGTEVAKVATERREADNNKKLQSKVTVEGKKNKDIVKMQDHAKDKSAIKKAVGKKKATELPAKVTGGMKSVKGKEPNIVQGTKENGDTTNRASKTSQGTNSVGSRNQEPKEKCLSRSKKVNNASSMKWIGDFSSSGPKHVTGDEKSSMKDGVPWETERKADSGRSQGTQSTPTDVTSDLTSDLYSGDSDSLESIEEVLDEVAFSSSSDSDLESGQKKGTSLKIPEADKSLLEGNKPKAAVMVLDPAVVLTKSEKKEPSEKPVKLSPKSPRTPKSGASTGSRKFIFKPVESQKGKKKVVKVSPGKTPGFSKGLGSKGSPTTSKKSEHMPKLSQSRTREGASESKTTESYKVDRQIRRGEEREGDKETLAAEEENKVDIASGKSHPTPVIIDIRDDLPECQGEGWQDGRTTSDDARVVSHPTVNHNRKKSALQQLGRKFSKGSGKTGGAGEKGSNKSKNVKGSKTGNGKVVGYPTNQAKTGKDVSRSPKVTPKKGKGKKTEKEDNLRIMSESESKNTAFITGQGWEIKTSKNEIDGIIVQNEKRGPSDVPNISQRKLSPANSLKIDFLAKNLPMSPEVIKNIANIMSPLEMDTPKFIPDTMDTIKEFAGSLSSVEEEKTRAIFTFSPVNSPKMTRTKRGKVSSGGIEGKNSPKKATPSPMAETPGSAFYSPTAADPEECDTSDLKTNPEFLKVFKVPDHCDSDESTPRSQLPSRRDAPEEPPTGDPDRSSPSKEVLIDIPDGVKDALKVKRKSINVMQKPPLSKFGLTKSQRKLLKRRQSAPSELPSSDEESSDAESVASSFRRRFLADIPDVPSEEGSAEECNRSRGKQGKGKVKEKSKVGTKQEHKETKNVAQSGQEKVTSNDDAGKAIQEDLKSSSKEQLLNEHVQTISIKTLQELNTILSNSEEVNVTSPLAVPARPISRESMVSIKTQTTHSLNQSLPMSESSVGIEVGGLENLRPDSHMSGEMLNTGRGTCLSSATSGDRSHSQSTNRSESEGELLHWKKGNVLGKGAFGTVYCGLTSTGQLIAVKQVELTGKHQAGEQYEKLQEEIELLKTLRHKNIVGFLGVSLEEAVVNIFMQYIPGGSIASLLARFGALEEPVFCRYTKQITDGMVYLHSNNVIHRDIKGANIMLMSNGVIKLIDFGCAKRLCIQLSQSQNLLKSMKGTPYWMAPEVIMETGHGAKSDVWSVGCTVMEMATRKPPWADMPPMSAIFAIGAGGPVPQLDEKFSSDARDFVSLCLTRNPDERATSLELLQHPFLKNRKERRKDSRLNSRSSLSNFDEGIMFKEQPILKETNEKPRKRRIFEDFE